MNVAPGGRRPIGHPPTLHTLAKMVVDATATFEAAKARAIVDIPWEGPELTLCSTRDSHRAINCSKEPWFPVFEAFRADLLRAGFPRDTRMSMYLGNVAPQFEIVQRVGERYRNLCRGSFHADGAWWSFGPRAALGWRRFLSITDTSLTFASLVERMVGELPDPFGELPVHDEALETIEQALSWRSSDGTRWDRTEHDLAERSSGNPGRYRATTLAHLRSLKELDAAWGRVSVRLIQQYGEPTRAMHGKLRSAWWSHGEGSFALWEELNKMVPCGKLLRFAQWRKGTPETMPPPPD